MLSEVEFLTMFNGKGRVVVYAGAAPGSHIPYLARMFPDLRFILVDPADFAIKSSDRIDVRQAFFDNKMIDDLLQSSKEGGGIEYLFISDIRTANPKVMKNEEVEACVARDMEWQMEWVQRLKPVASVLKFRLPWGEGKSVYLDGDIYLPVWGPQTTTECRLIVTDNNKVRTYDNREYEEQMFHFNTVSRVEYYQHEVKYPGLDHCYDCASELVILKRYLVNICKESEPSTKNLSNTPTAYDRLFWEKVTKLSKEMDEEIGMNGRTLAAIVDVSQRNKWFEAREYDVDNQKIIHRQAVNPRQERLFAAPTDEFQPRALGHSSSLAIPDQGESSNDNSNNNNSNNNNNNSNDSNNNNNRSNDSNNNDNNS